MNASPLKLIDSPAFTGGAFSWTRPAINACVCIAVFAAMGCATAAVEPTTPVAPAPSVNPAARDIAPMISPEALNARLGDADLVIVHVGHGDRGYQRGHLPGAIYLDFDDIYVNRDVAMEMPEAEVIEAVVRRLGIDNDSAVVLVGDASGVFPARFYVTLKHYGFAGELRLLDGQLKGWKARELPIVTDVPEASSPTDWNAEVRPGVLVTADEVALALSGPNLRIVLDVRPSNQFTGERRGPGVDAKGRIEGAVSLPWRSMFDGSNPPWLKTVDAVRGQLVEAGVAEGDPIIVYDSSGIHASLAMIVLQELGHEVSLYDGGFEAWSQR